MIPFKIFLSIFYQQIFLLQIKRLLISLKTPYMPRNYFDICLTTDFSLFPIFDF
jgi:hypothetical protein